MKLARAIIAHAVILSLFLVQLIASVEQLSGFHYYVAYGKSAVKSSDFPYQLQLKGFPEHGTMFCGASLISDTFILTAAHCLKEKYLVYIKVIDRTIYSSEFFIHSNYTEPLSDDIAILKITEPVPLTTTIQPIRLPSINIKTKDLIGRKAIASGWGETPEIEFPTELQWVELQIQEKCFENKICTDSRDGLQICQGDSGGPLVISESDNIPTLIGISIASNRFGCGFRTYIPSVFVDVSFYLDWISKITGIQVRK